MPKPRKNKVFLKADWQRLVSANYEIDPGLLKDYIPAGTELEAHNGKHYVSLVAFRYANTRLLNVRIPGYHSFEEVNLRFYVKREISPGIWRSEVAFTKLYFPKRALTFVAKTIYKENYVTAKMKHDWREKEGKLFTGYGLKKTTWNSCEILSTKDTNEISTNSDEYFFSKHYWGTSRITPKSSTIYEIEHPEWRSHEVLDHNINFDFANVFGNTFKHLNEQSPDSVHLFDGSEVVVNKKSIVE